MADEAETEITDELVDKLDEQHVFVHGANLIQKEHHKSKYLDSTSRQYLVEIRERYDIRHQKNNELKGPTVTKTDADKKIIEQRTALFSEYKDFIDEQKYAEAFDSRSNLHSSVLEEFVYYLFRDLIASFPGRPLVGKSRAFKDLFFHPSGYKQMVSFPHTRIELKDHDFVIGATIEAKFNCKGMNEVELHELEVPAIAIECKTYLDKTMLEGSSNTAAQLKHKNPNALYIVVMEWLKLTSEINLKKYLVDQIYVFRRQKNTDREFRYAEDYEKKPIDPAVIIHLYETVREHLVGDWGGRVDDGLERGWLI